MGNNVRRLEAFDHYVAAIEDGKGVRMIDVANPAAPASAAFSDTLKSATDLWADGSILYVAMGSGGVHIFNVSNPANPVLLARLAVDKSVYHVYVQGANLYVSTNTSTISIFNISNPAQPVPVGSFIASTVTEGIRGSGKYISVLDLYTGLKVFDVSDPSKPAFSGSYTTAGYAYGLGVSGNLICIANRYEWVEIVRLDQTVGVREPAGSAGPSSLTVQLHPNPVAAEATIDVTVAHSAAGSAILYNILGEKVATLYEGWLDAGAHSFDWNPASQRLPAGVYVIRVAFGGEVRFARCILRR
jgi:hypothetical protein